MSTDKKSPNSDRDRKGGLSCAECRRSKLKCDRVFPCQSCIRRGCGAICPDGTLAATKGNKVLMAHAQRLSAQVQSMSTRIRDLEAALAQTQNGHSHTLLKESANSVTEDILQTNNTELAWEVGLEEVSDAIGSLSIDVDGRAKYHGGSAGSEYLQDLLPLDEQTTVCDLHNPENLGLPVEVIHLMNAFPFGMKRCGYSKYIFAPLLPSRVRAVELFELYYKNAAWQFNPISRQDFMLNVIDAIYGIGELPHVDKIHSHRLSVFYTIMATGILFDDNSPAAICPEQYYALARAALSLDPMLKEATCATVQALFLMLRFMDCDNDRRASKQERWLLLGLATRVAQSIGLQRDSAGWKLDNEEIQRRRRLYWELHAYDNCASLVIGRPPTLMIQHTDARFPSDLDPAVNPSGNSELGYQAWRVRYSASCVSVSVQHVFSNKVPTYKMLLDLDAKIRKYPVPSHLLSPLLPSETDRAWSLDPSRAMQQYAVVAERESNLLCLHRCYFAQAIVQSPNDPLKHQYAPSVLAVYRSSCRLISSLKGVYAIHPGLTSKCWYFWSTIYNACVVIGALVVESPGSSLSQSAYRDFEATLAFYDAGSRHCRPPSTLTMLRKLQQRAYASLVAFHAGEKKSCTCIFRRISDTPDELAVLGGQQSVINNKSPPSCSDSPSSASSLSTPPAPQPSPPQDPIVAPFGSGTGLLAAVTCSDDVLMDYYDSLGGIAKAPPSVTGVPHALTAPNGADYAASGLYPVACTEIHDGVSAQELIDSFMAAQGLASPLDAGAGAPFPQGQPFYSPELLAQLYPSSPPGEVGQPPVDLLGLGAGTGQEQCQDEMWRNFMLSFGLE